MPAGLGFSEASLLGLQMAALSSSLHIAFPVRKAPWCLSLLIWTPVILKLGPTLMVSFSHDSNIQETRPVVLQHFLVCVCALPCVVFGSVLALYFSALGIRSGVWFGIRTGVARTIMGGGVMSHDKQVLATAPGAYGLSLSC